MSISKSSVRGRGKRIVGQGVDALFSTPADAPAGAPPDIAASVAPDDASASNAPADDSNPADVSDLGEAALTDEILLEGLIVPPHAEEVISEPPAPDAHPPAVEAKAAQSLTDVADDTSLGGLLTDVAVSNQAASSLRPQSPFASPAFVLPPSEPRRPHTPDEEARIAARIDSERVAALQAQIDKLYKEVPKNISNRPEDTAQILGMLKQARSILIEQPADFIEAEYKVQQALSLYNRIENAERWGDTYGWRIFWFEVVLFFLFLFSFLALLAFGPNITDYLSALFVGGAAASEDQGVFTAVGFWATFVWGGIGGVLGALYILWTHVSQRQDFERQHVMWYVAQPIMGLILGGVTFLIIETGLLSLQGGQPAAFALRTQVQLFPALIAFIAGFRPQFVFGLLIKIIQVINPNEEKEGR